MQITINDTPYTAHSKTWDGSLLTLHLAAPAADTIEDVAPLESAPEIVLSDGNETSRYAGRKVLELHEIADGSARIVLQADPIADTEADRLRAEIADLKAQLEAAQAQQAQQLASHDEQLGMIVSGDIVEEEVQEDA